MELNKCPRFNKCSTPICPLWKPIHQQIMLKGEGVCFFLLEYQKVDSIENFRGADRMALYEPMAKATEEIFTRPDTRSFLINALKRASKTRSRMLAGRILNA